jgi:hypothetical protein
MINLGCLKVCVSRTQLDFGGVRVEHCDSEVVCDRQVIDDVAAGRERSDNHRNDQRRPETPATAPSSAPGLMDRAPRMYATVLSHESPCGRIAWLNGPDRFAPIQEASSRFGQSDEHA